MNLNFAFLVALFALWEELVFSLLCPQYFSPLKTRQSKRSTEPSVAHSFRLFSSISTGNELITSDESNEKFENIENLRLSGSTDEFTITKLYRIPDNINWEGFLDANPSVSDEKLDKWSIDNTHMEYTVNVTLPIALMIWDSETFPSLSRARKACRHRKVVVSTNIGQQVIEECKFFSGKVGDRVVSGDLIGIQKRLSSNQYVDFISTRREKPSFDLPVVYEDDWMAIVNKPAGILVYNTGGEAACTVRFALPYVLKPCQSPESLEDALDRPVAVHRLDKLTCGLLVVAKTRSASTGLNQQFADRTVQKTYHAIVFGIPEGGDILAPSEVLEWLGKDSAQTFGLEGWYLAKNEMDGKEAVTLWRRLETFPSPEGDLSVVELMPKTGRYHQLRRHMAWVYNTPIVGDPMYSGGLRVDKRFHRGLMLCASSISLFHPQPDATAASDSKLQTHQYDTKDHNNDNYHINIASDGTNSRIHVSIDLPLKFQKFIEMQKERAKYL